MPLQLLGKKSWHVYNSANVERVKRDEAEAKAREEAAEQRLQQEDAARRTGILRGEQPEIVERRDESSERERRRDDRPHKRRRLRGEDDTDRDIRWAREDAEVGEQTRRTLSKQHRGDDRPLHGKDGHIQLVPVNGESSARIERNAEVEAENARRKQQDEDQYTMRFSNAAGYKTGMSAPWYADKPASRRDALTVELPGKDVWGNEDPRRKEREQRRMTSTDPLAFMQQAQRQLKQSERDRNRWNNEQSAQLQELKREQRSTPKHTLDDLPPLDLDSTSRRRAISPHQRHRTHHRHRRRSRSAQRERS